jgi:flagellar assembly protein FliH
MPVIKADQSPPQLSAFSLADIEKQAKLIILGAKVRAEKLLHAAQEEGEQIKRQAHAQALIEGRQEGLKQGLEQGRQQGRDAALAEHRQQLTQLLAALSQSLQALDASRLQLEADARTAVVHLALAIAQRVSKRQAQLDPQVAIDNVDDALRLVVHGVDVKIAIHPAQRATLVDALPRLQARWPNLQHIELIDDPTLVPGGCRVFTGQGQIDADLDLQLTRIAQELLPKAQDSPQP